MFCIFGPNLVSLAWTGVEVWRGHQGLPFLKIFTCPTSKICFFQYQIIYDLEEKIVQISLPDGQFYLPWAVGQWDMSSPGDWTWWWTDGRTQATTIPGGKKNRRFFTRFERFRTTAQVWIHRCLWNDAQSLMWYRRGALFFSRSSIKFQGHMAKWQKKITNFDPNWVFRDFNSSLNSPMDLKWCTKLDVL